MLSQIEAELKEEPLLISKASRADIEPLPPDTILVGAGDSYCAALCASYLSSSGCAVLDPYELIAEPGVAKSKTVVVISVSGRTRANIVAARAAKGIANEVIGVTANEEGPLSKEVDQTVRLPYEYRPRVPGMASFVVTLAYVARQLSVELGPNPHRTLAVGRRASRQLRFSKAGCTFFLGNRALFAVSIYAAAKLYEFFGAKSQYQRLEEFSHMELFSLKPRDAVNIYGGFDPSRIGGSLSISLSKSGFQSGVVSLRGSDVDVVMGAIFATQFALLRRIRELKIERPYILDAGKKLAVSDSMIY